ncbi:hypothetical protein CFOL_v3_12969, partial [Cephalotus follicularis]
ANSDGTTDSSKAFLAAWTNECWFTMAATIGPCKNSAINIIIDGTLLAPADYRVIGNAGNWISF